MLNEQLWLFTAAHLNLNFGCSFVSTKQSKWLLENQFQLFLGILMFQTMRRGISKLNASIAQPLYLVELSQPVTFYSI